MLPKRTAFVSRTVFTDRCGTKPGEPDFLQVKPLSARRNRDFAARRGEFPAERESRTSLRRRGDISDRLRLMPLPMRGFRRKSRVSLSFSKACAHGGNGAVLRSYSASSRLK